MTERSLKELARETAQSMLSAADDSEAAADTLSGLDSVEEAEVIHEDQMDAVEPIILSALQRAVADAREASLKLACEAVCYAAEDHGSVYDRRVLHTAECTAIRRAFAAAQDQDCGCKGPTCEWTDKPIRRAAQDDPEVSR